MDQNRIKRNELLSDQTLLRIKKERKAKGLPVSEIDAALANKRRRRQHQNRQKQTSDLLTTALQRIKEKKPPGEILAELGRRSR